MPDEGEGWRGDPVLAAESPGRVAWPTAIPGCQFCAEHVAHARCAEPPTPPTPRNDVPRPRRLLTRTRLAELTLPGSVRALTAREAVEVFDAYETAVRLLEECVRADVERGRSGVPLSPSDVAWLALREAER
jgi:hypothetical protein